ncbi:MULTISPECIES: hypothetical protein [Paenibacillus]|uniref:hypothetical protein n=1 Tax=Paenibacillus TaxID=44249 RepID=UPI0022821506|nr:MULTISPECIES: hypothetical protein [Paenibacillus]MCY7483295.1 hypothetical protein [Paenibacillus alvei]
MRTIHTPIRAMIRMSVYAVSLLIIIFLLVSCTQSSPQQGSITTIQQSSPPVAFVYYSTSLSKEYIGSGTSNLLYIDKHGTVQPVKGDGLEWNAPVHLQNTNDIVIQRREQIQIQHDKGAIDSTPSPCKVNAGYRQMSGYLSASKLYYALFNKGIDANDNYLSTIRWGDAQQHHCEDIQEFIEAQGSDEHNIYALTSDHATLQGINLVVMKPEGGKLSAIKFSLLDIYTGSLIVQSKIISLQNKLYVVFTTKDDQNMIHLQLLEIDKTKHTANTYTLHRYGEEPDNAYFSHSANSIGIIDQTLYYIDGYGTVFPFSLRTKSASEAHSLSKYQRTSNLNDEMGYVQGANYYLFRYDSASKVHEIEKYQLSDGALLKELPISNLPPKLSSGVYLYDFQMLTDL